jgi:hypothetical protein
MEYDYFSRNAADKRDSIVFIPQKTIIKKECLINIDNDEFVQCFKHLQKVAVKVYEDMIKNYTEYGIIANDRVKSPGSIMNCFGDVLYQIALISKINDNKLTVDIKDFKATVKKHKFNKILNKLRDSGFLITNHNGMTFDKDAISFDVSYPEMPKVINTLKGFALLISKYIADVKPSYHMYTHDMFGCFQYRYAEDETTRKYPEPSFMTTADRYSENGQKALYWLHDEADRYGFKTTAGFITTTCFMKGNNSFMSLGETKDNKIFTQLFLKNVVNEHMDMILALPEYLQQPFKESTCVFCGGIAAPGHGNTPSADGSCKQRFTYKFQSKVIQHCKRWFSFTDINYNDLSLVLELYKTENNIK